jgi:hypothetical protein
MLRSSPVFCQSESSLYSGPSTIFRPTPVITEVNEGVNDDVNLFFMTRPPSRQPRRPACTTAVGRAVVESPCQRFHLLIVVTR